MRPSIPTANPTFPVTLCVTNDHTQNTVYD